MQKRKNRKLYLAVLLLLLLAAAAGIGILVGTRQASRQEKNGGVIISEDVVEWDKELEDKSGTGAGIKIPGYGEITVGAGEKNWQITLANPKENSCYFQYEITIDEEEQPIYTSDYIEPGKAIREFPVTTPLEQGDHEIYFHISTYSMDGNNTRLNGADVKANLHVN